MKLAAEYAQLIAQKESVLARIAEIENDPAFAAEKEFETKLRSLMGEYNKSLRDIIALIDPDALRGGSFTRKVQDKGTRKPRSLKVYKNPHNNEVIETKGGNHTGLKRWKAEHGSDTVESWLQN
jgi:hypothetical protein